MKLNIVNFTILKGQVEIMKLSYFCKEGYIHKEVKCEVILRILRFSKSMKLDR